MINGQKMVAINNPVFDLRAGKFASARTFDADILRLFYLVPAIWGPMQCDDGVAAEDLDFDVLVEDQTDNSQIFIYTKIDGDVAGLFMFSMENPCCYSIHSALLPKYWGQGVATACGLSACTWMFENTACLKIITLVPDYNTSALAMAMSAGMSIEGVNRSSFMKDGILHDQTMLGFTKEELLCQ